MNPSLPPLPLQIHPLLTSSQTLTPPQRLCILTCGISGSGKSTFSHTLTSQYPTFTRLSIDTYIYNTHGPLPSSPTTISHEALQEEAESAIREQLGELLREGKRDVVLDLSFYSREWRDEYRSFIEKEGRGRYRILFVVFKGEESVIWGRLEGRRRAREQGKVLEGMDPEMEVWKRYWEGFEWPGDGEEHIFVMVE